jgi:hypothetical protein
LHRVYVWAVRNSCRMSFAKLVGIGIWFRRSFLSRSRVGRHWFPRALASVP